MSTAITPSPSPAVSPHNPFHIQSPRISYPTTHRSPTTSRASPRTYTARSPRQPFNAPPKPKEHFVESGPVAGSSSYVSTGTQYSPVGLPPTAGKVATALRTTPLEASASTSATKKRKEAAPAGSSPEPMSGTAGSSSSGAAKTQTQPPNEPQLRTEPARTSASTSSTTRSPEVKEARTTHGHSAAPKRPKQEPGSDKVMPLQYENCSPKDLGILIANMLMELIRINDQIPLRDGRLTRFHSRAPPGISVADYLQRLIQHATLSPPILLSMVYYIDRLCNMYPAFTINSLTVHRFLITAATVAAKGLSDSFWTNPTYARIGGIPVSELATLELELLHQVEWRIVPKPESLEEYYSSLVDRTDGYVLDGRKLSSSSDSSSLDESDSNTVATKSSEDKKIKGENDDHSMADGPT